MKIFLSFLVVLLVTEVLIFALFLFFPGRYFHSRFEQFARAQVLLSKELIEDRIRSDPETPPPENQALKAVINRLGDIYGAKVWLSGPDGALLLKSFDGAVPSNMEGRSGRHTRDFTEFKLVQGPGRRRGDFYATFPLELPHTEKGTVHLVIEREGRSSPERGFALGLAVIGVVVALLTVPVSRAVTKRVKRLKASALMIAGGDLSQRVKIGGKDEIGELGRAFNRMADKLERMVRGGRELTANISHELRSPLARIRIAQELLREKLERGDREDLERHLEDIREDIEEVDRLMERILVLSKMDIHEIPLRIEPLDPYVLMEEALEKVQSGILQKGLQVRTDLSFRSRFQGDKEALATALSNVLENAVKFTPRKGHLIVRMDSEDDSLIISVSNTFQTLSDEELTGIFEPFYRTKRTGASGSGLGLAITKKIIERHEGTIEATNSAQGLMLRIRLPLIPGEKGPSGRTGRSAQRFC